MGLPHMVSHILLKNFPRLLNFSEENYFKLNLKYFTHHSDKNFKYSFEDGRPLFNDLYSKMYVEKFGISRKKMNQ